MEQETTSDAMERPEAATLEQQIEQHCDDPRALEMLYRRAQDVGADALFRERILECARRAPDSVLLRAWTYRLDTALDSDAPNADRERGQRWPAALALSTLLGACFVWLADGQPPIPVPGPSAPAFWLGWAPLTALCILVYLALFDARQNRRALYSVALSSLLVLTASMAVLCTGRQDDVAALIAIHMPFVCWCIVGGVLAWRGDAPADQGYRFVLKSLSTVLSAGIFLAAGLVFSGLSYGIFAALGIELPDALMVRLAAFGIGAVPLLALASTCDPHRPLAPEDERASVGHLLHTLGVLLMPLSLAVLVIYLIGFVPLHFRQPFYAREVLAVYNGALFALLLLLALVASRPLPTRWDNTMRCAAAGLMALALGLNAYALTAICFRIVEWGLTPNRLAVVGWNGVTLAIVASALWKQWHSRAVSWMPPLRHTLARGLLWAGSWSLGLCYILLLASDS